MRAAIITIILLLSLDSYSQESNLIYLWPGMVPGENKEKMELVLAESRGDNVTRIAEITNPAIEIFLADPSNNNRSGVIVCPGGAYSYLAYNKEGTEIAKWLNSIGYSAFVLSYRVPDNRKGALQDALRAIRIVKDNSEKWNIDPGRTGIMGFSAGGSLSARTSTKYKQRTYPHVDETDSLSARPSFALLIYPAYLDEGPDHSLTPELTISSDTPPMFIFQTADDTYGNSALVMAGALRDAGIPVESHMLAKGGHGYGLRAGNPSAEIWPGLAERWLRNITH
jgi:acetyl esterase/lipase